MARASTAEARLARSSAPVPLRVAHARGATIVDEDGKEHIDLLSGWCVGNLGWAHPEIRARLRAFDGPDYVYPYHRYAPWDEFASRLTRIAPGRMARAFRATGGTEAVEIALQAAMAYTGRRKLVSLEGCYHGNSLATLSLADSAPENVLAGSRRIKTPLDERALGRLETALKPRDVAAFILEPISMTLGIEEPEPAFLEGARRLCDKHGALLIFDEVATGFGRTGEMFAADHYDVDPDIVCMAKGITSGAAPMGATLVTKDIGDEVAEDVRAHSTYGWHPLAVEAALATLDVWDEEGDAILRNVGARGRQLRDALEALDVGDVRAKGLAVMLELESKKAAERFEARCLKEGVVVDSDEKRVQMFPALTITEGEMRRAVERIARAAKLSARRS